MKIKKRYRTDEFVSDHSLSVLFFFLGGIFIGQLML